jgi:hypothetical protein
VVDVVADFFGLKSRRHIYSSYVMGKLATPCSVFCIVSEEFEGHWNAWLNRKKFVLRSIVCHLVTHYSVEL